MRLYLQILFAACSLLQTTSLSAQTKESGIWEVLENCQLVNAPINDGDSFKVTHHDRTFIVRLYFVDCPETFDTYMDRVRDQARYFSIPEAQVLAAGKQAQTFTKKFLRGTFTVITKWEDARGGKEPRSFALIRKDGQLLSAELVSHGLARIYGMPTNSSWPGGFTPKNYLKQLKHHERSAQRNMLGIWGNATASLQLAGLNQLNADVEGTPLQTTNQPQSASLNRLGRIILNTASAAELETLPGIGPVLASEIIAARPIESIEALVQIPGISTAKLDKLRRLVLTDEPPPPSHTAAFYLADIHSYLNKEVTVRVASVGKSDLSAPSHFQAVNLQTANQGMPGGDIVAFIPEEFYNSFIQYYQQTGREFTGLLFEHNTHMVLVYRRK